MPTLVSQANVSWRSKLKLDLKPTDMPTDQFLMPTLKNVSYYMKEFQRTIKDKKCYYTNGTLFLLRGK